MNPLFGPFHQVAYVTSDMDRALAIFRDRFGIPSFFVFDADFACTVAGTDGRMALRIALANVDGTQVELIEDRGSGFDLYTAALPGDGSFAIRFHHVCIIVHGDEAAWNAHLRDIDRPIHYRGDTPPGAAFVYTDERATVGHYIEHVWFGPEVAARMAEIVPYHPTEPPFGAAA